MRRVLIKKLVIGTILLSIVALCYPIYLSLTRITRFELLNNGYKQSVFDVIYNNVIEEDGYSYYLDEFNLYSYGPSGFIIADLRTGELWVMFDDESDLGKMNYMRGSYLKRSRGEEGLAAPYMEEKVFLDLSEKERKVYTEFRERISEKMEFPNGRKIGYWQRRFGDIDYMRYK